MTNNEAIGILAIVVETAKGRCFVTDEAISDAYDMAISALQAQDSPKPTAESVQNVQNEDLISRKAAIDALHTWFRDGFDEDRWWNSTHVLAALEGLPSAQPEPQWIPVSERLPEPRVDVWVNSDIGQIQGYYEEHIGIWYASFGQGRDYLELIVTAWMPLPEPYRAERRNDDQSK